MICLLRYDKPRLAVQQQEQIFLACGMSDFVCNIWAASLRTSSLFAYLFVGQQPDTLRLSMHPL